MIETTPRYGESLVGISASASYSWTRSWDQLTEDEQRRAREREGRTFGFARALDEEDADG